MLPQKKKSIPDCSTEVIINTGDNNKNIQQVNEKNN